MSSRLIKSKLIKKGYTPVRVEYQRSCPTPSGYGQGYDIEFEEDVEIMDKVFDHDPNIEFCSYMEIDTLQDVLDWIDSLPNLKEL